METAELGRMASEIVEREERAANNGKKRSYFKAPSMMTEQPVKPRFRQIEVIPEVSDDIK